MPTSIRYKELRQFLLDRAMEQDSPTLLFNLAAGYLISAKVIRPGLVTLMELIGWSRAAATSLTHQKVAHLLTPQLTSDLDRLVMVDAGLGKTRLAWLSERIVEATAAAVNATAERLRYLRGLDARNKVRMLFDGKNFAVLSTLEPDDKPHSTVVWVKRDGDDILFALPKSRRKTVNLNRDLRAAVVIFDAASPYESAQMQGTASSKTTRTPLGVPGDPEVVLPRSVQCNGDDGQGAQAQARALSVAASLVQHQAGEQDGDARVQRGENGRDGQHAVMSRVEVRQRGGHAAGARQRGQAGGADRDPQRLP
jgi:hypothetical protein